MAAPPESFENLFGHSGRPHSTVSTIDFVARLLCSRKDFGRRSVGRKRAQVTLTDVAKRAGVSVATASKAINERDEVAAATRHRVLQAAEELAFQPNVLARSLISGNTRTVGLLTDELSAARLAIPVLLGAENPLGNEQMSVLLCDARGDAIRRRHYIRTLLARQVDGFIILGDAKVAGMRADLG